ncbi:hypothetical protein SAMN06265379_10653 [Saccharicrinis carchari]|uniref:Uncharacterized protein n=1 Tax=Saccharicrinis carchari TaxID=1168039 RepID=A0A521DNB4_SACCC|nr:hypothetical protein SAMN06265379_10653 [Saccharicrinis carchari]
MFFVKMTNNYIFAVNVPKLLTENFVFCLFLFPQLKNLSLKRCLLGACGVGCVFFVTIFVGERTKHCL